MDPMRLTVVVLGRTLLDVHLGPVEPPAPAAAEPEPKAETGPVTDRRTNPTLGFAASASLPRDRRPVVR